MLAAEPTGITRAYPRHPGLDDLTALQEWVVVFIKEIFGRPPTPTELEQYGTREGFEKLRRLLVLKRQLGTLEQDQPRPASPPFRMEAH